MTRPARGIYPEERLEHLLHQCLGDAGCMMPAIWPRISGRARGGADQGLLSLDIQREVMTGIWAEVHR